MRTAIAAYQRFSARCPEADRDRPTWLDGWTAGDLIDHVTWGAAMQAAAVRSAAGLPATDPVGPTVEEAIAAFEQAAEIRVDPGIPVTLPGGTVPMAYAAALFAFEAALHAADLEHALTDHVSPFTDEELTACEVVIGPMLDLIASTTPTDDVVIDLIGLGDGIRLSEATGVWRRGVPDERPATTTLTGSSRDLVLFVCGRTDASALRVEGDAEHSHRFKAYFPGP